MAFPGGQTDALRPLAFPLIKHLLFAPSKPGKFIPTPGLPTTANSRTSSFANGPALMEKTPPIFPAANVKEIHIWTTGFPTGPTGAFCGRPFPSQKKQSVMHSRPGYFHPANAPATTANKPTPNFVVGRALIQKSRPFRVSSMADCGQPARKPPATISAHNPLWDWFQLHFSDHQVRA